MQPTANQTPVILCYQFVIIVGQNWYLGSVHFFEAPLSFFQTPPLLLLFFQNNPITMTRTSPSSSRSRSRSGSPEIVGRPVSRERYLLDRRLLNRMSIDLTGPSWNLKPPLAAARDRFWRRHGIGYREAPISSARDLMHQICRYGDLEMLEELNKPAPFLRPTNFDLATALNEKGTETFFAICKACDLSAGYRLAQIALSIYEYKRLTEAFDRLSADAKRHCLRNFTRNGFRNEWEMYLNLFKRLKPEDMVERTPLDFLERMLNSFRGELKGSSKAMKIMDCLEIMDRLMSQRFYTAYWRKKCLKSLDSFQTFYPEEASFCEVFRTKIAGHCPCRGRCRCDAVVEYQDHGSYRWTDFV